MKGKTRNVTILLTALLLILWCACAMQAQRAGAWGDAVSVRWAGEAGASPAQILRQERYALEDGAEHPPQATLWREYAGCAVSRPGGGRSAGGTVARVFGDPGRLWPLGFAAGGWPVRGDADGCAVSADVAAALWGGADVVGMPLVWEGRTYTVRGVFRGAERLVVVQGEGESESPYPGLLLTFPQGGGREEAAVWLASAGLSGGTLLDLGFLAWCLGALAALPALALCAWLAARALGRLWRLRTAPLLLAQALIPALALAGAALWAAGLPAGVPARLIPTRWSDFSFWPGLARELGGTVRTLFAMPQGAWDLALWGRVLSCLALAAPATAAALFWAGRARPRSGRALFLGCLGWMALLFAAALFSAPLGGLAPSRGMWLLPPLWLAAGLALARHETYLTKGGEAHEDPQAEALAGRDARPEA